MRLLCILFIFTTGISVIQAQKMLDLHIGAGFTEVLKIGGHYYSSQHAIGISGLILPLGETTYQLGMDYKYHALGKSKHAHLRPWYIKGEALYRITGQRPFNDKELYVFGRVGRSIFFNSNMGIELEGGLYALAWEEHFSTFGPLIPRVFLSGGVLFFYRWEIN